MRKIPQDIIGDIAVLKFPLKGINSWSFIKKLKAKQFLKQNPSVKTVLEKTEKFSGELRLQKTKFLAGINKKETTYKENNCLFKFNVDETYFSPRLSNERKLAAEEILNQIKKNKTPHPKIVVMFSGVAPYPITIAKTLKQNGIKAKIISSELNTEASKYAEENVELNKLEDYIQVIDGDSKKLPEKIKFKADFILMPRPNLEETFLKTALKLSKKSTRIYYHGFGTKEKVLNEINNEIKSKVKNIQIRKAGDIGPYIFRWLVSFVVK